MNRIIKEVNLPLTKTRCEKIRWSKEYFETPTGFRTPSEFESATQEQKELFFIYQDNLESKILCENGEWATDWELQLWWLVHKQHHPKTKDWNSYDFTIITEQQKAWLVGHILGDLGIGARLNKDLTWSVNLKFDYKEESVNYLNHLWSNYPSLQQRTEPHKRVIPESTYTDSDNKEHHLKKRYSIFFKLLTQQEFKYFLEEWFQPIPENFGIKNKVKWKKLIPNNIETLIDNTYKDELLAYWFIDDGSSYGGQKQLVFNTQNFDLDSLNRLQEATENVYGISLASHVDGSYYRSYVPVKDLPNLVNRVKKTLLPDFYYKISKDYQHLLSKLDVE